VEPWGETEAEVAVVWLTREQCLARGVDPVPRGNEIRSKLVLHNVVDGRVFRRVWLVDDVARYVPGAS
jgi:hypothetical protein